MIGRFVVGFGVGVAAVAAPLYAAELAPAAQRGRYISSYQLAITIGIFLAYFVDRALAGPDGWRWDAWRLRHSRLCYCLPRSFRRWNCRAGCSKWGGRRRRGGRLRASRPMSTPGRSSAPSRNCCATSAPRRRGRRFWHRWREPLKVGLGLAVLQQVTGINAIIYYSNSIFAAAGSQPRRPGGRDDLGHRGGERARDLHCAGLHRPARASPAADGGADRHGAESPRSAWPFSS